MPSNEVQFVKDKTKYLRNSSSKKSYINSKKTNKQRDKKDYCDSI